MRYNTRREGGTAAVPSRRGRPVGDRSCRTAERQRARIRPFLLCRSLCRLNSWETEEDSWQRTWTRSGEACAQAGVGSVAEAAAGATGPEAAAACSTSSSNISQVVQKRRRRCILRVQTSLLYYCLCTMPRIPLSSEDSTLAGSKYNPYFHRFCQKGTAYCGLFRSCARSRVRVREKKGGQPVTGQG